MNNEIDNRHVYSAGCSWSGPISATARNAGGLPCCPHCGSVLFEINEEAWKTDIAEHEKKHPGLQDFLTWSEAQPRCWKSLDAAAADYAKEKNNGFVLRVPGPEQKLTKEELLAKIKSAKQAMLAKQFMQEISQGREPARFEVGEEVMLKGVKFTITRAEPGHLRLRVV